MAYSDASRGWGLTPSAASENLARMAGGGYGSQYGGGGGENPVYEQRMAQIRGNFATRQAQLAEARRRMENNRAHELALKRHKAGLEQWQKKHDIDKEQWTKEYDFGQRQYQDQMNARAKAEAKALADARKNRDMAALARKASTWTKGLHGIPSSSYGVAAKNAWLEYHGYGRGAQREYEKWQQDVRDQSDWYNWRDRQLLPDVY